MMLDKEPRKAASPLAPVKRSPSNRRRNYLISVLVAVSAIAYFSSQQHRTTARSSTDRASESETLQGQRSAADNSRSTAATSVRNTALPPSSSAKEPLEAGNLEAGNTEKAANPDNVADSGVVASTANLPQDLQKQLETAPVELPPDLKAQLNAPPPELPEDIKQALKIPPRKVSIEEVNNPLGLKQGDSSDH